MQRRAFLMASAATAAASALAPAAALAKLKPMESPLLAQWTGPHGGAPAFDKVSIADFKPALMEGIARNRKEVAAIAASKARPTFANTIAPLEDSGRALTRVGSIYGVWTSTLDDKPMQAIEQEMSPILAAFNDEIIQNKKLFARVKAVYDAREHSGLTPEQQRLTWVYYRRFARQGAALDAAAKTRMGEINKRLSTLYTTFSQNELGDEEDHWLVLEASDLDGLPDSLRTSAAAAATAKKLDGKYVIANTRSAMEPFLTYSTRRDLREQAFRMWTMRGDNGDKHDNNAIITEILQLRAEKAKLLGYASFAHWITDDQMAKTPDAAMDLMLKVWKPAVARVHEEVADMQAMADSEGAKIKIAPWDYRFYAEKVRKARYDLDESQIKPYLQMEKIRAGAFWCAGQLYGFDFVQVADLPTIRNDVFVFEVRRDGKHLGLWYHDPYARAGKQSGAWMSEYRSQERFKGAVPPIVSNNQNFVQGAAGEPTLLSWDDAVTIFHEFGHGLHGLNSNVVYPTLAGTNVVRDFVEFPSQLNEHWVATHEVLTRFTTHYKTGEPMPDETVAKIKKAHTFNQGFATVEYLASAIVDMKAHLAGAAAIDPHVFEKTTLAEIGMPEEIVMRHRMPHFGHIFSGDGYAAGYYDYIWADTLVADAAEAFAESPGGYFDHATAKRLHDTIISRGNTVDAGEAFRAFRGRDVTVDALMRERGFPVG
jgi:peptidyl-dipeptidase Dcp